MDTKQLFKMNQDDITEICNGACGTSQCPFKKSLRGCREDGFCIKQTYHNIDKWILNDEYDIKNLKDDIKIIRQRIMKYRRWRKKINKELEND